MTKEPSEQFEKLQELQENVGNVDGSINAKNVCSTDQFTSSHHSVDKYIVTNHYYLQSSRVASRGCKHPAIAFC